MSRELLLLRHGKSDWDAGGPDFDRPLNRRGRRASDRMGRYLAEQQLAPDQVLASPARRAADTARRVCATCGFPVAEIRWERAIYEASLETLVAVVQGLPDAARRMLVVGHNPGLELLVAYLCPDLGAAPDDKLMPTAALAHIALAGRWREAGRGSGRLLARTRPKDL